MASTYTALFCAPVSLVQVPLLVNSVKATAPPGAVHFIPDVSPESTVSTWPPVPPTGSTEGLPVPSPASRPPLVDMSTAVTALAPLPMSAPLAVRLVVPVPPLPTGNCPETPVPRATCAQAGELLLPVFVSDRVEFASFASLARALAPLA